MVTFGNKGILKYRLLSEDLKKKEFNWKVNPFSFGVVVFNLHSWEILLICIVLYLFSSINKYEILFSHIEERKTIIN